LSQGNSFNPLFRVLRNAGGGEYLQAGFYTGTSYLAHYNTPLSLTGWTHIAVTWILGAKVQLYVNGGLVSQGDNALPGTPLSPVGTLLLGVQAAPNPGFYSLECLDDLCIWSYQMPAALVQQVYRQSSLGWPGRLEARPALVTRKLGQSISLSGTGGISQGGDPQTMPVQIALDTFAGTAGTELSNHTPDSGGIWTEASGYSTQAFITSASRLRQDSNNVGQTVYYHSATPPSPNYTVAADVYSFSRTLWQTAAGVVARYDASSGSFYAASYNHHAYEWELLKYQGGSFTTLGTYAQTISTGQTYTVRLSVSGVNPTYLTLSVGGAVVISVTDSGSPIIAAGKAGVLLLSLQAPGMTDTTGDHLDNFIAGTSSSGIFAGYRPPHAGGTAQGGGRSATVQFSVAPRGGTNLGGMSAAGQTFACLASGGVHLGSAAGSSASYRMWPGGGVTAGGSSSPFVGHTYTVSPGGGLSHGGKTGVRSSFAVIASGGTRQGGVGRNTWCTTASASGGMAFSGGSAWQGIAYHVYANTGVGDPINYSVAIAVVDGLTWTSSALAYPGVWKFGVRAFNLATNQEEQNVDAVVKVVLNAAGADTSLVPPPPLGLSVHALAGSSMRVLWSCPCSDQNRLPTGFHVYLGQGGTPDYGSPIATVLYSSGRMGAFSTVVSGLSNGAHAVAVRSFNSIGEEANTSTVTIQSNGMAPELVDALSAVATNQDP
jgi:hypothetical protein